STPRLLVPLSMRLSTCVGAGDACHRNRFVDYPCVRGSCYCCFYFFFFFFKQKTAYEIGLGIPAEPLFRSLLLLVAPCLNCLEAVKKPPPVAFKVMCLLPITIL